MRLESSNLSEIKFTAEEVAQVLTHLNSLLGTVNLLSLKVFPFPWPEDLIEHKSRQMRRENNPWPLKEKLVVLVADEVDELIAEINFVFYSQKNSSSVNELAENAENEFITANEHDQVIGFIFFLGEI